jgi:hypothetical protein
MNPEEWSKSLRGSDSGMGTASKCGFDEGINLYRYVGVDISSEMQKRNVWISLIISLTVKYQSERRLQIFWFFCYLSTVLVEI